MAIQRDWFGWSGRVLAPVAFGPASHPRRRRGTHVPEPCSAEQPFSPPGALLEIRGGKGTARTPSAGHAGEPAAGSVQAIHRFAADVHGNHGKLPAFVVNFPTVRGADGTPAWRSVEIVCAIAGVVPGTSRIPAAHQ